MSKTVCVVLCAIAYGGAVLAVYCFVSSVIDSICRVIGG